MTSSTFYFLLADFQVFVFLFCIAVNSRELTKKAVKNSVEFRRGIATKSLTKVPVIAPGRDDPLFEPPAMDATDLFHQASSHLHFQDRQLFAARTSC